jgi:stage II sporulation protein GA (sporulation sigma-E factor processing peptidase)
MRVVYADTIFLLNAAIDYILLLLSAKICGASVSRARMAASAAVGGLYAAAAAAQPGGPFASAPVAVGVGVVMTVIAYGGLARAVRLAAVFFAASAAFAGVVLAVRLTGGAGLSAGADPGLLFVTFAACYAVLSAVFRGAGGQSAKGYANLTIKLAGRELSVRALLDTGSSLRDPLTGRSVVVVGADELGPLFPREVARALSRAGGEGAVKALEALGAGGYGARFRLVPYSAVGVRGGMLPAFRPDETIVDGQPRSGVLIAVSPNSVSDNGMYSALMPAEN